MDGQGTGTGKHMVVSALLTFPVQSVRRSRAVATGDRVALRLCPRSVNSQSCCHSLQTFPTHFRRAIALPRSLFAAVEAPSFWTAVYPRLTRTRGRSRGRAPFRCFLTRAQGPSLPRFQNCPDQTLDCRDNSETENCPDQTLDCSRPGSLA